MSMKSSKRNVFKKIISKKLDSQAHVNLEDEKKLFVSKHVLLKTSSIKLSIANLKKMEILDEVNKKKKKDIQLVGKSCCVFGP